ncbi:MAG: hypothetical protein V2I40_11880 [Desulfobacteraceae bacterium]|nr:hypothetical protein [Desulfobacteraceae bacterium]
MIVDMNKIAGLCCTCNYRRDCLSLRNSLRQGIPIMHCEEFDNRVADAVGIRLRKKPKTSFLQNHAANRPGGFKFGMEV